MGAATPRYGGMDVDNDQVVGGDLSVVAPDHSVAGGLSSVMYAGERGTGGHRARTRPGQGAQGLVVAREELVPAVPREELEEPELRDVIDAARSAAGFMSNKCF